MEKKEVAQTTQKTKLNKILGIAGNVFTVLIILLAFCVVMLTITAKRDDDGTATIFGRQIRFVQSGSMEKSEYTDVSKYKIKSIPIKSCVFIEVVPTDKEKANEWYSKLAVGDVLTFKYVYSTQETITHRIVQIDPKSTGGYVIKLQGDNKNSPDGAGTQTIDTSVSGANYIIGKVVGQSYILGLAVYAFSQPVGILLIIIIPCLIMIVLQVLRIVRVTGVNKKQPATAPADPGGIIADREREIEELKKRLSDLEKSSDSEKPSAPQIGAAESVVSDGAERVNNTEPADSTETAESENNKTTGENKESSQNEEALENKNKTENEG